MKVILSTVFQIASVVLIARAVLSWIRPRPGTGLDDLRNRLTRITEPVLGPVRRLLPQPAGLDLSPMVVLLAINLVAMPLVATL